MGPRRGNNNASWDEIDTHRHNRRTSDLSSLSGRNGMLPTIKSQKGFDPDSPANRNGGLDHSNRSNYSNNSPHNNYHQSDRLPNHNNRNIKTNHSLRSNHSELAGGDENNNSGNNLNNGNNGNTAGWDELQDEIATAMAQSMAIGTG